MNKKILLICLLTALLGVCRQKDDPAPQQAAEQDLFIRAVDVSSYSEIATSNQSFFDLTGNQKDFLAILKENGVNTLRLRLWVNPNTLYSGFDDVKAFSQTIKQNGFNLWITVHYSDTWADPANQQTPSAWQGLQFESLNDSVYQYTQRIVTQLKPNIIQIGNEINSGMLHPYGNMQTNLPGFIQLLQTGVKAVRQNAPECKIMLHFAGIKDAPWFFNQVSAVDYDIIGLSYYPIWHGKSLAELKSTMDQLQGTHQKKIMIAETAYPFTLDWNDWTNNIVGLTDQLILPNFPATPQGQKDFIKHIHTIIKETSNGMGFCYWGGELVAWKGKQATDGSPWENQALFDFNNKALPVMESLKKQPKVM
ncbi:MAG: arabinogalactan endo-1,4-beta-galactosidase [Bacteroidia bacterium]|jgi:arabinogalactan endo-1,4-beta-galactosidase|nr:arabinogalactan endo-1,4-beta-galactosidase [Bacteroidia bacterium]